MTQRQIHELATRGARGAVELRYEHDLADEDPICVYDFATRLGVNVRFHGGGSFGGMYDNQSKTIVVPALRPPGRQVFTCGHELGHWYFGHGTRIDIVSEDGSKRQDDKYLSEERLVNAFAAHLLMPSRAVRAAFHRRGWDVPRCSPIQLYGVACQLGVGYSTLIHHMHIALRMFTDSHARNLLQVTPKKLRFKLLGLDVEASHMVLVDRQWSSVAVDLRVDDAVLLPSGATLAGTSTILAGENPHGVIVRAVQPGITQVETLDGEWSTFLRVSRREYVGLSAHRFLEEIDEE